VNWKRNFNNIRIHEAITTINETLFYDKIKRKSERVSEERVNVLCGVLQRKYSYIAAIHIGTNLGIYLDINLKN
jgi:hypothetical protein